MLVGRQVESAVLATALDDLGRGQGRSVLIEGEPGSGKTALLETLLGTTPPGITVRGTSCVETDQKAPLAALLRALRSEAPDPTEAEAVRRVLAILDDLCARGPLLLAVDDLHAADEAGLLVWQRLSTVARRAPLLLVATIRPVPRRPEIDRIRVILKDNDGVTLALDRLPPDAVTELATRLLGRTLTPRLATRLESAGGNPRLIHELVAAETAPEVDSLAAAVVDRLGFLDEDIRELLRTAALLGAEFSVTELATVLHRPAGSLAAAVQEALTGGVLEPVGPRLRFRHGLLRQALQESTPEPVRAAMRLIAIRALMDVGAPAERIAELLAADPALADGWETPWVTRNAAALARRAPDHAADLFEHVLSRRDADRSTLVEALATLSFTLYALGRRTEADRVAARIEPEPELAAIWRARLAARAAATQHDAARALAEGESLADPMTIAYALAAAAVIRFRAADLPGCHKAVERALLAIGPPPRLPDCRRVLNDIRAAADAAQAYREGRWDDACTEIDSVADPTELHGLAALIALRRDDELSAAPHLAVLHTQDPYADAARATYAERATRPDETCVAHADGAHLAAEVERLRPAGRPPDLGRALEELAVHRARDGDAAGARIAAAEALDRYGELGAAWDARRVVARLRALGVRTGTRAGRRPSSGRQALTESELRVAEHLSQGKSNPDIAEELSLSRRTVETHVSRILAKLGVRSRREAAELLRRD